MKVKAMVDANTPRPRDSILDIKAYVPGGHAVDGHAEPIVLSANETPLGPSPAARDAFRQAAGSLERYPDGSAHALREAIGEVKSSRETAAMRTSSCTGGASPLDLGGGSWRQVTQGKHP